MGFGGQSKKAASQGNSDLEVIQNQAAAQKAQQAASAASAVEEDRKRAAKALLEEDNAKRAAAGKTAGVSPLIGTSAKGLLDNPRTGLSVLGN
jgi:hypothetical protein